MNKAWIVCMGFEPRAAGLWAQTKPLGYCGRPTINTDKKSTISSGQPYKASTLVNYDSRVINISNLLGITPLESYFTGVKCL